MGGFQAAHLLLNRFNFTKEIPMTILTNTILNADCIRAMDMLPDESVDFILTDPPYITRYRSRDGRRVPGDDNDRWLVPSFRQLYRVLRDGCFCVSFYGWPQVDRFMRAYRTAGFRIVGHLMFPKRYASSTGFVQYCHESAYLLAKGEPSVPENPIADVIAWEYTGNHYHPTQKPLAILLPLVEAFSPPGGTVLDPFAGSGSSLLAAKRLGRSYIGMELDPAYHAVARKRLARETHDNGIHAAAGGISA